MKGKKASPEQRIESLTLAFALMARGARAEFVEGELRKHKLFPYAANGLRGYFSRWKRGVDFTDIVIDDPSAVIQRYTASEGPNGEQQCITAFDTARTDQGGGITVEQCITALDTESDVQNERVGEKQCITAFDTARTDIELLGRMRAMLNQISVMERPQTAPGRGKPIELKTAAIGARLPVQLVQELRSLPGRTSHHIERALVLYLRVLGEKRDE